MEIKQYKRLIFLEHISEKSESWNFYLEGSLQSSYIPFPAKIISPNNQSVVNLSSGKIILSWEGIDLDNDIQALQRLKKIF